MAQDYAVKDISLAEFGEKEIQIAEHENATGRGHAVVQPGVVGTIVGDDRNPTAAVRHLRNPAGY